MHAVKDLLDAKGREVYRVARDASLSQCARAMLDHGVGSVLVFDGGKLVGIFTWHDLIRAVALHDDAGRRRVHEYMSTELVTTTEAAKWEDVEAMMIAEGVRHLPVVDGAEVVGVIDRHDVIARRCGQVQELSEELHAYIRGNYPT